jgi:DNA-binding XRE family transcriptional regulator
MFNKPFSLQMKENRRSRSLTQAKAAASCGISRVRWSHLERGYRRPSQSEKLTISRYLNIDDTAFIPPIGGLKTFRNTGSVFTPTHQPYFPPRHRPTCIRYFTALKRHRNLVLALTRIIKDRPDFDECEYFGHRTSCDSYLEALYILSLQASGAKPALIVPALLGHTPLPIVAPDDRREVGHRPHLCLICDQSVAFFQTSFPTPRLSTVDLLVWDGRWRVVEINGEGHDSTRDFERQDQLKLPVEFLEKKAVLAKTEKILGNYKLAG